MSKKGMKVPLTGGDKEWISEKWHPAVCAEIVDQGIVDTPHGKKRKCRLVFQVDERNEGGRFEGHRKEISSTFNLTLGERSSLKKFLTGWKGEASWERFFDIPEGGEPDLYILEGRGCAIEITHEKDADKRTFHQIRRIRPPEGGPKSWLKVSKTYTPIAERQQGNDDGSNDDDRSRSRSSNEAAKSKKSKKSKKSSSGSRRDEEDSGKAAWEGW